MTSDFGTFQITYTPPAGSVESGIQMSITGEADLNQMLSFFESFMRASGYLLEDRKLVWKKNWESTPKTASNQDFWGEDGFSLVGNPYSSSFASDTISFASSGMVGGLYNDVITLG